MQVCTSLQTDNHASTSPLSFLQAGCPSCRPTNSASTMQKKLFSGLRSAWAALGELTGRGVHGSCARHLTAEYYTVVMLLTFVLFIISIPSSPHSFIPGLKIFLQILPTVAFIFFFRTDSTDSPRTVYRYFCAYAFFFTF